MHGQPPSSSRAQLRALGLRPHKRLSQAFLESNATADAIVASAELTAEDEVLEIGPGLGVLTRRLTRSAQRVVSVELDRELAAALGAEQLPRLVILQADALAFEPTTVFAKPYVVVANLPYHITSPVLRHLLASGPPFAKRLVVMVQAEVADRIAAEPGNLSALAVSIQAQARVEQVLRVPRTAFYPRPKVDSAVLRLTPLAPAERLVQPTDHEAFVSLVQAGFKQPRKTLLNSLSDGLGLDRASTAALLRELGISGDVRPQALELAAWVRLFHASGTRAPMLATQENEHDVVDTAPVRGRAEPRRPRSRRRTRRQAPDTPGYDE